MTSSGSLPQLSQHQLPFGNQEAGGALPTTTRARISEVVAFQVNSQVKTFMRAQKKQQQDSFEGLRDSLRAEFFGSTTAPTLPSFPRPPFTSHLPSYPPPHYPPILHYPGYASTISVPPLGGRGVRVLDGRGAPYAGQPTQPPGLGRVARASRGARMRNTRGFYRRGRGGQGRGRGVQKGI